MSFPHSTAPWAKELQVSAVRSILHGVRVSNKSAALFWLFTCDSADSSATASRSETFSGVMPMTSRFDLNIEVV